MSEIKKPTDSKLQWGMHIFLATFSLILGIGVSRTFSSLDDKANKAEVDLQIELVNTKVNGLEKRIDGNIANILSEIKSLRDDLKLKKDKETTN